MRMRRTEHALVLALLLSVGACERADEDRGRTEDPGTTAGDTSMPAEAANPSAADSVEAAGPAASPGGSDEGAAATTTALRAALDRLVRGAATESGTWFSGETADIIRAVEVGAGGRAVVDFVDLRSVIPNASSSAGSQMLLDQLNTTVFAVPGVTSVEYRMAGSCALLGEWLQYGTCLRFDRP